MQSPGIPDDVLELILLHLASPVNLIRAATTCKRWHGIVAGARFLRRFGSLNGRHLVAGSYHNSRFLDSSELEPEPEHQAPAFVGSYHNGRFLDSSEPEPEPEYAPPAFVASSPPAAGGVDGERFSLDFLWEPDEVVDPYFWRIKDSRGGLLLWALEERYDFSPTWSLHVVVCDPLARRYRAIPPLVKPDRYHIHSGPFLLDGDVAPCSPHVSVTAARGAGTAWTGRG
ncbi:uncharacterized protein [Setaria viridis]|uniref:uncharacterized protein n=1 Tax=Setaria viridis TaxID=4556 RepID=UPI003B3A4C0A